MSGLQGTQLSTVNSAWDQILSNATGGTAPPAAHSAMEAPKEKGEKPRDPNLVLVKSPIVGTFYEAASPEAPPFVRIGERVQPGKVLCIIESMKLMNEI